MRETWIYLNVDTSHLGIQVTNFKLFGICQHWFENPKKYCQGHLETIWEKQRKLWEKLEGTHIMMLRTLALRWLISFLEIYQNQVEGPWKYCQGMSPISCSHIDLRLVAIRIKIWICFKHFKKHKERVIGISCSWSRVKQLYLSY